MYQSRNRNEEVYVTYTQKQKSTADSLSKNCSRISALTPNFIFTDLLITTIFKKVFILVCDLRRPWMFAMTQFKGRSVAGPPLDSSQFLCLHVHVQIYCICVKVGEALTKQLKVWNEKSRFVHLAGISDTHSWTGNLMMFAVTFPLIKTL